MNSNFQGIFQIKSEEVEEQENEFFRTLGNNEFDHISDFLFKFSTTFISKFNFSQEDTDQFFSSCQGKTEF